jgi:ABC-type thiamin/hydroxymethylpyrimidine transport system permease subunit
MDLNSETSYEAIIILSLVGTLALTFNSEIFVTNVCNKGVGYCVLFLVMKYISPLMMASTLIAAIWGYGKTHVKKYIRK